MLKEEVRTSEVKGAASNCRYTGANGVRSEAFQIRPKSNIPYGGPFDMQRFASCRQETAGEGRRQWPDASVYASSRCRPWCCWPVWPALNSTRFSIESRTK